MRTRSVIPTQVGIHRQDIHRQNIVVEGRGSHSLFEVWIQVENPVQPSQDIADSV
jgi:hypothetical protein